MNYKISFQERVKLGMKMIAKQKPVTLEQAKKKKWVSERSTCK
jgi:hypothetical protein